MAIAIEIKNLSKAYQLGVIGTGTLSRDLERWYAKVRGREDPFLKIGETNDRTTKGGSDIVWSLKEINFQIEQGDAVGIIGRNGAGKSTLLKLLSRVTSPTTGEINVKGRIASLLEVGTGFHPELTGRENIFLNGAILGMRKKEITRKFDEIVEFAGVERYIDTPVKRYSSGMYVRLAFAVAAHLESEILIVDEVLAVGDAEFQKKCLGKMSDVRGEGRTVLFVSHNMSSIQNLCNEALLLQNGSIIESGICENVISTYLMVNNKTNSDIQKQPNNIGISKVFFTDKGLIERNVFAVNEPININLEVYNTSENIHSFHVVLSIYNQRQELVSNLSTFYNGHLTTISPDKDVLMSLSLTDNCLLEGKYTINIALVSGSIFKHSVLFKIENYEAFQIEGGDPYNIGMIPKYGSVLINSQWSVSSTKFNSANQNDTLLET